MPCRPIPSSLHQGKSIGTPRASKLRRINGAVPWLLLCQFADVSAQPKMKEGTNHCRLSSVASAARVVPQEYDRRLRLAPFLYLDKGGRVRRAWFNQVLLSSEDIKLVAGMTGLESLRLAGLDLRGIDLGPLAACESLEVLSVSDSRITDVQLMFTRKLSKLHHIDIRNCRLAGNFLPALPTPRTIETLTLSNIQGLDGQNVKSLLAVATNVRFLDLMSNDLADDQLSGLASLSKCQSLLLNNNNRLTDITCSNIGHMRAIKTLAMSGTRSRRPRCPRFVSFAWPEDSEIG